MKLTEPWDDFFKRTKLELEWPDLATDYDNYLHAVGRLSSCWNFLEDTFLLFFNLSKLPPGLATYLGFKLNNNDKIEIMKILAAEYESSDPESSERARVFFRYASICAENRNFVMHSSLKQIANSEIDLEKKSKSKVGSYTKIRLTTSELRAMSQEASNTAQFGARLQLVMLYLPNQISKGTDGSITRWPLLDPPPEPKHWQQFQVS